MDWDERFLRGDELRDYAPSPPLPQAIGGVTPGSALDLACGAGRHQTRSSDAITRERRSLRLREPSARSAAPAETERDLGGEVLPASPAVWRPPRC